MEARTKGRPRPAAGRLQQVECARQVHVVIEGGVVHRGADAGHGSQVDDADELVLGEEAACQRRIPDVPLDHRQARGGDGPTDLAQVGPLALRRVVGVEVVEADDRVTPGEQHLGDVAADKAGGPGDKVSLAHRFTVPGRGRMAPR